MGKLDDPKRYPTFWKPLNANDPHLIKDSDTNKSYVPKVFLQGPDQVRSRAASVYVGYPAGDPDDLVVLKVFPGRMNAEETVRWQREWQVVSSIASPNIARGRALITNPQTVIVQEYVDGIPLNVLLAQAPEGLGLPKAREIGEWVLRGLVDLGAFAGGTKHRDIKPGNIIVTPDRAVIVDLGLAKPQIALAPAVQTTPMMSAPYASPEQWARQPLSTATDIYSWGVTILRTATGWDPSKNRPPQDPRTALAAWRKAHHVVDVADQRFLDLLAEALNHDPASRPTAALLNATIRRLEDPDATAYVPFEAPPSEGTRVLGGPVVQLPEDRNPGAWSAARDIVDNLLQDRDTPFPKRLRRARRQTLIGMGRHWTWVAVTAILLLVLSTVTAPVLRVLFAVVFGA